jgi:hypothetical protein
MADDRSQSSSKSAAKQESKPAEPTDWRKSWGKADERPAATATGETRSESKLDLTTTQLPQADTKRPDPLQLPAAYAKRSLGESEGGKKQVAMQVATTAGPAVPASYPTSAPVAGAAPPASYPTSAPVAGAAPPASYPISAPVAGPAPPASYPTSAPITVSDQRIPLGAQSVVGNGEAISGNIHYIPVPIITVPDVTRPPTPPPQAPMLVRQPSDFANGGYHPPNRALNPSPMSADPAVMNAFTRPLSNDAVAKMTNAFGSPDQGPPGGMGQGPVNQALNPNAMMAQAQYARPMDQGMAYQGMAASGPNMTVAYTQPSVEDASSQGPMSQQIVHLTSLMRDSLYPSQREWAAEGLTQLDWRKYPQVSRALLMTACEDPAGTVRAACIHCMAKMQMNTLPVINALQTLKADSDERVRHEAEEALSVLAPGQSSTGSPAQPAGGY